MSDANGPSSLPDSKEESDKKKRIQSSYWCFCTFHSDFLTRQRYLDVYNANSSQIRFFTCQREICPKTKSLHIQGYLETKRNVSPTKVKRFFKGDKEIHIEFRKLGSREQCKNYCDKLPSRDPDGFTLVLGTWIDGPGHRTDLAMIGNELRAQMVEGKVSNYAILRDYPAQFIQYNRAFAAVREACMENVPHWRRIDVQVLWGKPGAGKTSRAFELHDPKDVFIVAPPKQGQFWYDGYMYQPVIVIDDVGTVVTDYQFLLNMTDGFRTKQHIKSIGMITPNWTTVYLTSNLHPDNWPGLLAEVRDSLFRRISKILHILGPSPVRVSQ